MKIYAGNLNADSKSPLIPLSKRGKNISSLWKREAGPAPFWCRAGRDLK